MNNLLGSEYTLAILPFIVVILQIIEAFKKGKSIYGVLIIIVSFIIMIGVCISTYRKDKKENGYLLEIDSLSTNVIDIRELLEKAKNDKRRDSLMLSQFLDSLRTKYSIKRDSVTNMPVKITTFNTTIDKARDVFIGTNP